MNKKLKTQNNIITKNSKATENLGQLMAKELNGGETLALLGNLGAGKTTFLKGLAKGLGIKQTITSPTFVLIKVYPVKKKNIKQLVHVDCYRLPALELMAIGLNDYLNDPHTIVAIEWANKIKLPPKTIAIKFLHHKNPNQRTITWSKKFNKKVY